MTEKNKLENKILEITKAAKEFHGHLGPFLVLGVKMGLIGLKELGAVKGDKNLHVTANLTYKTPISCILDGLQYTTSCTLGNTRLKVKESETISVTFEIQRGNDVTVKIDPVKFKKLKNELLGKKLNAEEMESLAYKIAALPDSDIFLISKP